MEIKKYDKLKKGQRQTLHDLWDELVVGYWDVRHKIPLDADYNALRDDLIAAFADKADIILKEDNGSKTVMMQWMLSCINNLLTTTHDMPANRKYKEYLKVHKKLTPLISDVDNHFSALANVAALLKETFSYYFWVGFYIVNGNQLELGPFQGPVACYSIKKGRGVCGTAWEKGETIIVPDVEQFPGHIACSSKSRSEIVVPVFKGGDVVAVIDVDSANLNAFNEKDKEGLEAIAKMIKPLF